jgi:glycosyltransferase involved in cell wall biosynthesis
VAGELTIAYLTGEYARASDTFIRDEVAALRDRGHEVHTFSVRRPEQSAPDEAVAAERDATDYVLEHGMARLVRAAGARTRARPRRMADAVRLAARVSAPGARGRLWPAAYLVEAAYLAERLEALGVDHLHEHIAEGAAAVAMMASTMTGVPFSMTVHGPGEFERAPRLALDVKAARAAFVAAISDYARAELFHWVRPEDRGKVEVVRCGVPERLLERPLRPTPARRRLVNVGRLEPAKGQLALVDAAAQLVAAGEEPFEIAIAGDGPLRGELERRIAAAGVGRQVTLLGPLAHGQVVELIADSRALVMSSVAEGLPVTIMEALGLGRPVVAPRIAGIPELVSHGENGWLVPAGDRDALADAIGEVLRAEPEELDRMGSAGHERVARDHDIRRSAATLAGLFARSGGGRPE